MRWVFALIKEKKGKEGKGKNKEKKDDKEKQCLCSRSMNGSAMDCLCFLANVHCAASLDCLIS